MNSATVVAKAAHCRGDVRVDARVDVRGAEWDESIVCRTGVSRDRFSGRNRRLIDLSSFSLCYCRNCFGSLQMWIAPRISLQASSVGLLLKTDLGDLQDPFDERSIPFADSFRG